jgi:hypothetical protein
LALLEFLHIFAALSQRQTNAFSGTVRSDIGGASFFSAPVALKIGVNPNICGGGREVSVFFGGLFLRTAKKA